MIAGDLLTKFIRSTFVILALTDTQTLIRINKQLAHQIGILNLIQLIYNHMKSELNNGSPTGNEPPFQY